MFLDSRGESYLRPVAMFYDISNSSVCTPLDDGFEVGVHHCCTMVELGCIFFSMVQGVVQSS